MLIDLFAIVCLFFFFPFSLSFSLTLLFFWGLGVGSCFIIVQAASTLDSPASVSLLTNGFSDHVVFFPFVLLICLVSIE
jgi:hypothetical protein